MGLVWEQVVIGTRDPATLGRWWCEATESVTVAAPRTKNINASLGYCRLTVIYPRRRLMPKPPPNTTNNTTIRMIHCVVVISATFLSEASVFCLKLLSPIDP